MDFDPKRRNGNFDVSLCLARKQPDVGAQRPAVSNSNGLQSKVKRILFDILDCPNQAIAKGPKKELFRCKLAAINEN